MRVGTGVDTVALDDLSGRVHARLWQLEQALASAHPLAFTSPQAQQAFDTLRLVHDASEIERWLQQQTQPPALDREPLERAPVQSMG